MINLVDVMPVMAQIVLLITILVVMLSHLFISARVKYLSYGLSQIGLLVTLLMLHR